MIENTKWFNEILFPAPSPTYNETFPGLFRIPRRCVDIHSPTPEELADSIPAVLMTENPAFSNWILYSHGNACDIGEFRRDMVYCSGKWQANVIAYEYPGYGISTSGGSPSASSVKKDATRVYQFLREDLKIPSENLIIFGRSIGSGPSVYLAKYAVKHSKEEVAALILQSAYTSISNVASGWNMVLGWVCPKVFDNIGNLQSVSCPLLLIHGAKDGIIKSSNSIALHKSYQHHKKLVVPPDADHNRWDLKADVADPVAFFLRKHVHPDENFTATIPRRLFYKSD